MSVASINDATKILPAEELIERGLERLPNSEDTAQRARLIMKIILTIIALFDVSSDWFQAGHYYHTYGLLRGEDLRRSVFQRCSQDTDVGNLTVQTPTLASAQQRVMDTHVVYVTAASLGTLFQLCRLILVWAPEKTLARYHLGWCKVNKCPSDCVCFRAMNKMVKTSDCTDMSVMEVIFLQLSLFFQDFPMTLANFSFTLDSCKESGGDTVVLVSCLGSLLGAFYIVCVYSLHVFFTMAPDFGGYFSFRKRRTTAKRNFIFYPLIVLLMMVWFSTFGLVYTFAMWIGCCTGQECCVLCCWPDDKLSILPLFLRSIAMVLALSTFYLNLLCLYFAIVGNSVNPEFGYKA